MGNADVSIDEMSTTIDLSWLKGPLPDGVVRGKLVSGDQDLDPAGLPRLREKYGAAAGDCHRLNLAPAKKIRRELPDVLLIINDQ